MLLTRLQDLDDAAWTQFAERFRGPIVNMATRAGLREDRAEDAAQSALLAFLARYREGRYDREKGRLSSWLFGIAYREIQMSHRRGAREERQAPGSNRTTFWSALPDETEAHRSWDEDWKRIQLEQCLDRVRGEVEPTSFEAFERVAVHHQSPAQVAEALGITRNAVFIAKHRVLKRLREARREFDSIS